MRRRATVCAALLVLIATSAFAGIFSSSEKPAFKNVSYGTDSAQKFDVYTPAHAENAPIIFMVHGGAWKRGDKEMGRVVDNKSAHYLSQGYIFVSANYRMDHVTPIDQAQDVIDAVAEVEKRAGEWGGDPSRVILMGHSAGAHLVALVSSSPPKLAYPWLGSVFLDSAALDMVSIMQRKHYGFYDDVFGKDENFWQLTSPYHQLHGPVAPVLLVCSTRRDDSCPQAQAYMDKAIGLGTRAELLEEDLTHAEINADLGKPGDYTTAVDQFIASVLK